MRPPRRDADDASTRSAPLTMPLSRRRGHRTARARPYLATLALLTLITWATGTQELRFRDTGNIAFATGFPGEVVDWEFGGHEQDIDLDAASVHFDGIGVEERAGPGGSAYRLIELDPAPEAGPRFIVVDGVVTLARAPSPLSTERSAAFLIWFLDTQGKAFGYRTVALLKDGSVQGSYRQRTVEVPEHARRVVIALVGRDSDGAFKLSEVDVVQRVYRNLYPSLRIAMMLAWAILAGYTLSWLFRRGATLVTLSIAVPLVLTFLGIAAPEGLSGPLVITIEHWLAPLLVNSSMTFAALVFKGGHFLVFILLTTALLVSRKRLRLSVMTVLAALTLLAIGTEGMQLHLSGRTTRPGDVIVDLAAVLCALTLIMMIERLRGRGSRKRRRTRRRVVSR